MKTYSARTHDSPKKWFVIDASNLVLGRLAAEIALRIRGKTTAAYTPNANTGEGIIVINAGKFKITGKKLKQKNYYSHSRYPGSLKQITLEHLLKKKPTEPLRKAVFGMLPKNPMGREVMKNLRLYPGSTHEQGPQQPEELNLTHKLS